MALKKKQKAPAKKPAKPPKLAAKKSKPAPKAAHAKPGKPAPKPTAQKKASASAPEEGFRLVVGKEPLETRIRETLLLLHDHVGFEAANIFETGTDGKVRLLAAAHDDEILVLGNPIEVPIALPPAAETLPQSRLKVWVPAEALEDGSSAQSEVTPVAVAGLSGLIVPFKAGEDRTGALVLAGHGSPAYVERDIETCVILTLNLRLSFGERYYAGFQEARAEQTQKAADELKVVRRTLNEEIHTLKSHSEEITRVHQLEVTRMRNELEAAAREAVKAAEHRIQELDKTLHSERTRLEGLLKEERGRHEDAVAAARKDLEQRHAEERKTHAESLEKARKEAQSQITELNQLLALAESETGKKEHTWKEERAALEAGWARQKEEAAREKSRLESELQKIHGESRQIKQSLETTSSKATEGESRLRILEKEKSDLARSLAEVNSTLEKERATAAKALEAVQTQLSGARTELSDKLAAAEKRVQELSGNLGPLEAKLAEARQEIERERTKFTALEANLRESKDATAKAADDLHKEIASLKERMAKKEEGTAKALSDFEKETTAAKSQAATLEKRIQDLEQRETRYLQESYEAVEKATTAESALERERGERADEKRVLETQLAAERQGSEKQKREFENQITSLKSGLAQAEGREKILREENESLSLHLSEEKSNVVRIESEKAAVQASRDKTASELATFESRAQAERDQLSAQYTDSLSRVEADLAQAKESLAGAKTQTADLEKIGAALRSEIAVLRSQKEETENQLQASHEKQRELRADIETRESTIGELEAAQERLKQELKKAHSDIEEIKQTEARLRQEIGMQRERALRLEQAIAGLEEEKHGLKNEITVLKDTASNRDREIDGLKRNVDSLTDQLDASRKSERRLSEELSTAQARERGSRDEGRVLAEITGTLARIPDLRSKLLFMTDQLKERVAIERLFMYSCPTESTIRVEEAFWGGELADLSGRTMRLRDTVFGEPLASRKGRTFEGQENADMPEEISASIDFKDKNKPMHFFVLPLAEADKAFGLLTVGTVKKLTDPQIRLIEHIAPILGVALKFELNRTTLADAQSRRSHLDEVSQFLETRFAKAVTEALRAGLGPEEKRESMPLMAQMLPDAALEAGLEGMADELPNWTERLLSKASARGIHTNVDLNEDILTELSSRIGPALRHVYWLIAEAVDNVIQHSQARNLDIKLERAADSIRLSVTDDGEGLIRTAGSENPKKGTGLTAIRNLAGAAGASAAFPRSANGGLSVRITWK